MQYKPPAPDNKFSLALEQMRLSLGWTLAEWSARLGIAPTTYWRWRSGRIAPAHQRGIYVEAKFVVEREMKRRRNEEILH